MSQGRIGRAGVIIASGTLLSRLLGLLRTLILVYAIGAGLAGNAFTAAGRIPNFIYTLIITGALTAVLVPQITKAALHKDGGQMYINRLVTLAITGTVAIVPIVAVLTPSIITFLGANWGADQLRLATLFAWWLLPQIVFYSLYTVAGEVLNAKSLFGPYAWTPVLNNIITITGMLVFIALYGPYREGGMPLDSWDPLAIFLLAGCSTLGVAVQGLALFIFWRKVGLSFRFDFRFRGIGLGTMGKVSFWTFLTVLVAGLVGLVYTRVQGLANDDYYAGPMAWEVVKTIAIMPHSVIIITLVTANFTRMSESVHAGNIEQMKRYLVKAMRIAVFAMVIIISAITLLSMPVIRIIRPSVSHEQIQVFAPLLAILMCGMLAHSLIFVINRGFFSMSDTRKPFIISSIFSVLALGGALIAAQMRTEWIVYTLGIFDGLVGIGQATVTFAVLRTIVGPLGGWRLLGSLIQTLAAAFLALVVGFVLLVALGGVSEGAYPVSSFTSAFVTCALVAASMAATYLVILRVMKNEEAVELLAGARRTLGRLRPR